jgi:hypothetical protein
MRVAPAPTGFQLVAHDFRDLKQLGDDSAGDDDQHDDQDYDCCRPRANYFMYIVQLRVEAALGRLSLNDELRGHEEREGGADSSHHRRPSRKSARAETKPEREPRLKGREHHSRSHDHGLAAEVDESASPTQFGRQSAPNCT